MEAERHAATTTDDAKPKPARVRKSKPADRPLGKRAVNLSLPIEVYERLAIHALKMTGGNMSDLVSKLAREHLRDYHVSRTGRGPGESGE